MRRVSIYAIRCLLVVHRFTPQLYQTNRTVSDFFLLHAVITQHDNITDDPPSNPFIHTPSIIIYGAFTEPLRTRLVHTASRNKPKNSWMVHFPPSRTLSRPAAHSLPERRRGTRVPLLPGCPWTIPLLGFCFGPQAMPAFLHIEKACITAITFRGA